MANFEHALEVRHHSHLFVKLGRLGQAGRLAKIVKLEHVGSAFRAPTDDLGCVDLSVTVIPAVLTE